MSYANVGAAIVLAGSLLVSPAASSVERNGQWWSMQDRSEKATYLLGLLDGLRRARIAAGVSAGARRADCSESCQAELRHFDAELAQFDGVSVRQLSDALETLYGDARNRTIPLADAVDAAVFNIRGDEARAEAHLQALRRAR